MHDLDLTGHWAGILALIVFGAAFVLAVFEEATHMRKSKPVMLAAGMIWALIGIAYATAGQSGAAHENAVEIIAEYGELLLFLIAAITCVNTLEERRAFDVLRVKLVDLGLSYRQFFVLTSVLAFFLSGVLDNLTAALVKGVVAMARDGPRFVVITFVSVVVAANAGRAFFTHWRHHHADGLAERRAGVLGLFLLFVPSVIDWVVPLALIFLAVPKYKPAASTEKLRGKPGMTRCFCADDCHGGRFQELPSASPALRMMPGLGYRQIQSDPLKMSGNRRGDADMVLDAFNDLQRVEWDTSLFFFGIIFAVGGLGVPGYLGLASEFLYADLGDDLCEHDHRGPVSGR